MPSWNDSLNWQKGKHSLVFGGGWFLERDHYWNGPGGYPAISLGLTSNDPLQPTFVSALKALNTTQQGQANTGGAGYTTARNGRIDYRPSPYDIRHTFRASGTYDLPLGTGKRFLNSNRLFNKVVGGWTLGTIVIMQSGPPSQVGGGYLTVNAADSGVIFQSGFTAKQLQSAVGVYRGGNPWVLTIDPKLIGANGQVSPSYYVPNTTPGVWGYRPYIYGPHWFNADLSVNKSIPIRESIRFTLQAQFLNVFNHPTFNLGTLSATSLSFSQVTGTGPSTYRRIEFRANIEF